MQLRCCAAMGQTICVYFSVCVCVCCEFMKATSAHVGIQQGHPTPSGKTWPLQQSRHHLQTSHVFFWTRYAYTTIPIYPGQRCVRATGHKQWIIRQRDDVTYPYLVETYIYAHISMTDTDTHTHTHIYIYMFKSRSSIWISLSNSPSLQEVHRHRIESPDPHAQ